MYYVDTGELLSGHAIALVATVACLVAMVAHFLVDTAADRSDEAGAFMVISATTVAGVGALLIAAQHYRLLPMVGAALVGVGAHFMIRVLRGKR